jgi:hypothetical protein
MNFKNLLSAEINLYHVEYFRSYLTENTLCFHYEDQSLNVV